MSWVIDAVKSSVGKKVLMACTGLLLCLFLIVHLIGNVLMYVGPDAYNTYAHTLHSQEWFVKIAESGLAVLFLVHIWLALETNRENREARPQKYARRNSKIEGRKIPLAISPENTMLFSGITVLIFLLIHLGDFTLNLTMPHKIAGHLPFDKAIIIMRTPISAISYLIGVVLLGWHLAHGVTSMFQTLGLKHPKYDPLTRNLGPVFGTVIAIGFASFPLFALFSSYQPPEKPAPADMKKDHEQHSSLSPLDLRCSLDRSAGVDQLA
ncbi:MAG: succinate dehydrogenase cytochrome b subunit [Planctomycetaceae bacterium]|nr:succinate dehydrogenase cytochrome b subunit [Planctomycetaceae bacterium]